MKAKVSSRGCAIETWPVDIHLFALKNFAKIKIKDGYIIAEAKKV